MEWKRQVSLGYELSIISGVSILILISGMIGSNFLLVFIGLLFLLFVYANKYYLNHVGRGLTLEIDKELIKLFKGEKDHFILTINQHSYFPILNAKLRFTIDHVLQFENNRKMLNNEQVEIEIPLSLLAKGSVEISFPFEAVNRGVAKIRTVELRIPHLFGFGDVYLQYAKQLPLETVVYSHLEEVGGVNRIIPKRMGDYPMKQSFYEDLSSLIGARDYIPSDSFNRIHWKASAKAISLQTKLYEKTSQFSWSIFINVREGNLESLLSGLTYLLEYATKKKIPFEIFVNVRKVGKRPYIHHPLGNGREHLQKALEIIARLSKHSVAIPFPQMLIMSQRQHILSPYVILCGKIEGYDQMIKLGLKRQTLDCYSIVEHDDALVLKPFSLYGKKVSTNAI